MRIDIHNYEAFFLDYKEGNLDAEQVHELFAFLEEYPQLKAELDSFEPVTLELEETLFDRSSLKKKEMSEDVLVAYVENTLGHEERAVVELMASQNVSLANDLRLYSSTIVTADEQIKFPRKSRLKKRGVVIFLQTTPAYLRVAAALLFLIGLFFLVSKLNTQQGSESVAPVLAVEGTRNNDASKEKKPIVASEKVNVNLAAFEQSRKGSGEKKDLYKKDKIKTQFNHVTDELQVATNTVTVNTSTLPVNNDKTEKQKEDSLTIAQVVPENKNTYHSYFNYSSDDDENENTNAKTQLTASAEPGRKTLFQRITKAARKVNALGVKKIEGDEQSGTSSISIGSFVLSETVSN